MSFKQSILIPLSLFKQCKIEENIKSLENSESILDNENMPSSEKMKLFHQNKFLQKNTTLAPLKNEKNDNFLYIINQIPDKYKPYSKAILEFIRNQGNISWNNNLELIIDGELFTQSNIISILNYLLTDIVVTRPSDIPIGSQELEQKMLDLGLPSSWITKKRILRGQKRQTLSGKTSSDIYQFGQGREKSIPCQIKTKRKNITRRKQRKKAYENELITKKWVNWL